ncbi:MAG TPA: hypothetical protein VHH91_05295, partial [Vicinamibacterales bacterium]|nr:hypothetical protein [Vicinamibacterales bacterium]
RVITLSDVRTAARFGLVDTEGADIAAVTLERLIDRTLMLAEVERYVPPEPEAGAVRERVDRIRARFANDDAFRSALRVAGIDGSFVEGWARNDLRIERYLEERFAGAAEPTEEDVIAYIRRHEADLRREGRPRDDPEVRKLARAEVARERRRVVVEEWVGELRARADVSTTPAVSR